MIRLQMDYSWKLFVNFYDQTHATEISFDLSS